MTWFHPIFCSHEQMAIKIWVKVKSHFRWHTFSYWWIPVPSLKSIPPLKGHGADKISSKDIWMDRQMDGETDRQHETSFVDGRYFIIKDIHKKTHHRLKSWENLWAHNYYSVAWSLWNFVWGMAVRKPWSGWKFKIVRYMKQILNKNWILWEFNLRWVSDPILQQPSGPRLNIKTVFPRYEDSHVKDKTVGETVLSITWESLYW